MLDFLAGPALPKDKEIYMRVHAWWAANDVWCWLPNPKPAFSKEHVKNLKALSSLLDESKSDQRIIKAEIAREMGNFESCLKLLSYQVDEGYEYAANFIKKFAQEKVRAVKSFEPVK